MCHHVYLINNNPIIGHFNNTPIMQFFTGIFRNTQSNSYTLQDKTIRWNYCSRIPRLPKIAKKLNLLSLSCSGAIGLKTTLEKCVIVKRMHSGWDWNLQPPDHKTSNKSNALPLSYMARCFCTKKILGSLAQHLAREYRERTTPSRIFMPCSLSSCRVCYNWLSVSGNFELMHGGILWDSMPYLQCRFAM